MKKHRLGYADRKKYGDCNRALIISAGEAIICWALIDYDLGKMQNTPHEQVLKAAKGFKIQLEK